jgi:hypothetical protein
MEVAEGAESFLRLLVGGSATGQAESEGQRGVTNLFGKNVPRGRSLDELQHDGSV